MKEKKTLWLVVHTHWEGAVFKTRDEYLEDGFRIILNGLNLMQQHPDYRFVLDQVCHVKPFLERYPEQRQILKQRIAEGRLEIVGGMDIMPDVNMPAGESFVRQVLYGKRYWRETLGVEVASGWLLDTFGHHAQMPQLLNLAGLKSYWFFRGVQSVDTPSEFLWQGIDGSRIPAFWLPYGYSMFHFAPGNKVEFDSWVRQGFAAVEAFAPDAADLVGLAGADVSDPEGHVPGLVEQFNRDSDAPFSIRFGVPSDFERVAAERVEKNVIEGEFNPVFQGSYSSRIDIKQWVRALEVQLTTAEKLDAIAHGLGAATEREALWRAWEPMLFNQTHDLMSGVMVDKVYDDSLTSFRFSERLVEEIIDREFDSILAKIDTRGEGIPVVVFNGQGWSRTDVAEIAVAFSQPGIVDVNLQGPDGEEVPVQITEPQRFDDGGLRQAKLVFVAEDIPALGYAVYHVLPQQSLRASGQASGRAGSEHWSKAWSSGTSHRDSSSIENEFYRATFNCWTGEMTSLYVKDGDWEALSGPANVIAREHDGGDFWELYGNLDGARNIAMSRPHAVPTRETGAQLSNQFIGAGNVVEGLVFTEFNSAQPFGSGSLSTRVRVYNGIRRVEIRTTINNEDRFVRYRAVFPTACKKGTNTHEIPFGAIERAEGIEFPAQRWVDCGDGQRGVALLNRGLPGNNTVDGTLLLSLMRSARINSYAYQGGYEAGAGSDSGLMEGRQLSFDYALMPHGESWREAQVYRAGYEFNEPLLVRKAEAHAGVLCKRWGLLELSQANVVVSALKVGEEGATVFRVYEAEGKGAAGLRIKLNAEVESAAIVNLVEDVDGSLEVEDNSIQIDLGPFEIKTLALRLRLRTD
jgi:alpha-mannosidase